MRIIPALTLTLLLSPALAQAQALVMEPGPKSPADSLKCIQVRPGFTVELMAAEPTVMSPIAFAWGADGKFWVVEMGDYPLGLDNKQKAGGRVKFLEKTKPDGPYDKATLFLDNLSYPTGVTPWGKGVLITCAPDIFYAEDTTGNGKADKKVVLFTGFKEGNPQHRVNGLAWGLDNWLYGANGDSGGKIKSIKTGKEVSINGRDFRIKPDAGLIEPVSGQSQFGRARDDWGNWFGNNNTNPMYHYVLEDRYLKRNPHVIYPDVRVQVSETPGASRVYPISKPLPRFNTPAALNHFTSACSAIVYRDNLFGPDFANNTFVSEPVHNLIHREIMTPKGVTFTSKRAPDEQTSEFLASSDNWFRPTTIQTGPDGALWVADMYRYVIEHPEWIPKDWQKKLDLRAGQDKGRIYRVYPEGKKPREIARLDKMNTEELVKALDSPSGWQRDTAQRLLIASQDQKSMKPLARLIRENKNPVVRLHAFCSLSGLFTSANGNFVDGKIFDFPDNYLESLDEVKEDLDPAIRLHWLRFNEWKLKVRDLELIHQKMVNDSDPRVRMQLAYSLGFSTSNWPEPQASEPESNGPGGASRFERPGARSRKATLPAGRLLGQLFVNDQNDRYMVAAVFSSINKDNWSSFFANILEKKAFPVQAQSNLLRLLQVFGKPEDKINWMASRINEQEGKSKREQFAMVSSLLDGMEESKITLDNWLGIRPEKSDNPGLTKIKEIMQAARVIISDPKASVDEKSSALRILGRDSNQKQQDQKLLSSLLVPQVDENLQLVAAQSLGKIIDPQTPSLLLKSWKGYSPSLRAQVLDVLISRQEWIGPLLDSLEKQQILPSELDAIRRQKLLQQKDGEVRKRAERLLATAISPDREKIVNQYILTIPQKGDADLGKKLFVKNCSACHQLAGVGQQVGPDLASVPDKSLEGLLTSILDPNRVVEARYVNYLATTKAGQTLSGVLFAETSTGITLVAADGKKHELLRRDLDDLASTGKSPMPEGLEKEISPKEMADLIEFLRAGIPTLKPRQIEGNKPELIKPDAKGVIKLLPQNGAIYGKNLILEKKHGNLGYWSSVDDHVVWTVDVPAAGSYAVELEWACADDNAGNIAVLQLGSKKMTQKVAGTGTWDDYRVNWIGTVQLPRGKVEMSMRAEGTVRGALIDLKGIYLVPK